MGAPMSRVVKSVSLLCALALTSSLVSSCGGGGGDAQPAAVVTVTPTSGGGGDPVASPTAIYLNQFGFMEGSRLKAIIADPSTTPQSYELLNDRNQVVLTGSTTVFGTDPASALDLHQINASLDGLSGQEFQFRIGETSSERFGIGERYYHKIMLDSLSYFYQSRVDTEIQAAFVPTQTPPLTRPAGHTNQSLSCFSGTDLRGTNWPGCGYALPVSGGWYDAGDYGQYVVNTGFTTWMLLNMAERGKADTANSCAANLGDGTLVMPEAGNGVSDILDEARVGIEYMLAMQTSSIIPQAMARGPQAATGPLTLTMTSPAGMAHHKSHGTTWPAANVAPHEDPTTRRLYPPTTAATLHLAAVGAQCARLFATVDVNLSQRCLLAARAAYDAAERVPDSYAWGEFDGGGPFDDQTLSDEFGWAATEMWLTTGEVRFENDINGYIPTYNPFGSIDFNSLEVLGILSFVANESDANVQAIPRLGFAKTALVAWADRYQLATLDSGFMIPKIDAEYYWGSNGNFMNWAMVMAAAGTSTGEAKYQQGVLDSMDYILGRNALNQSYISGYGDQRFQNPYHRFWRGGSQTDRPIVPRGVLAGGANSEELDNPAAAALRGNCTGMTCWSDDQSNFTVNEIAINWNVSLAWVSHWLDRQDVACTSP